MSIFYRKLAFHPSKKLCSLPLSPFQKIFIPVCWKGFLIRSSCKSSSNPTRGKSEKQAWSVSRCGEKHQACRVIKKELDLYDLLPYADAAVTQTSTVGLEAMLFQKPVLIGKSSGNRSYPYYESLGDFMFDQPDELARTLVEVLQSPDVHQKRKRRVWHS